MPKTGDIYESKLPLAYKRVRVVRPSVPLPDYGGSVYHVVEILGGPHAGEWLLLSPNKLLHAFTPCQNDDIQESRP